MRNAVFGGLMIMALGGCFRERPASDASDAEYSDRDEYQYVSSPGGSESGDGAYYGTIGTVPAHQPAAPSVGDGRARAPAAPTLR